jgi:hypothetical protein
MIIIALILLIPSLYLLYFQIKTFCWLGRYLEIKALRAKKEFRKAYPEKKATTHGGNMGRLFPGTTGRMGTNNESNRSIYPPSWNNLLLWPHSVSRMDQCLSNLGSDSKTQAMKPFTKTTIPYTEVVAMADMLLAKPPEFFEPFLGKKNPSFDEISALVKSQVKERFGDEIWINDIYQVAVRRADRWSEHDNGWSEMIHLSIK